MHVSEALADHMAECACGYWHERNAAEFLERMAFASRTLRLGRCDWLLNSLGQADGRKGRGYHNQADCFWLLVLMSMIDKKELFLRTVNVPRWARYNHEVDTNEETLSRLPDMTCTLADPREHDWDGLVKLGRPTSFLPVNLDDDDPVLDEDAIIGAAGRTYPLEIGAVTFSKSVANLYVNRRYARLPYELAGGEPMLFIYSLSTPAPSLDRQDMALTP